MSMLFAASPVWPDGPRQIGDLLDGHQSFGFDAEWTGVYGDSVFLTYFDGVLGGEVARLDPEGLTPLTDICPGQSSSFGHYFDSDEAELDFEFFADHLYFVPLDCENSFNSGGLWKLPVAGGPAEQIVNEAVSRPLALGERLIFNRHDANFNSSLWSWDGESLDQIDEGRFRKNSLIRSGSQVFYYRKSIPSSLYVTDGESSRLVSEIPERIVNVYPVARGVIIDVLYGSLLWSSDGTAQGTFELVDFPAQSSHFATASDRVFYSVPNTNDGSARLWSTDGTVAGSAYLPTYCTTACNLINAEPKTTASGLIYFVGQAPGDPQDPKAALWRSDGTISGTFQLSEVGPSIDFFHDLEDFVVIGERAFMIADVAGQAELWVSDGTIQGTRKVQEAGSKTRLLGAAGERAILISYLDDYTQASILSSDGTGVEGVASTVPGIGQPSDSWFFSLGEEMLLSLREEDNGARLWQTDGSVTGTRPLEATTRVGLSSNPKGFTAVGEKLYFTAGVENGRDVPLWSSEGDLASTERLHFGLPDTVKILGSLGEKVVVFGRGELWVTDGTAGGSRRLADFETPHASEVRAVPLGTGLLVTDLSLDTAPLWFTDGTPAGTRQIAALELGGELILSVHSTGTMAFIRMSSTIDVSSNSLWRSDGTAEGTFSLPLPAIPLEPQVFADRLFFRAGSALWSSDGSSAGTEPVVDATEISDAASLGRLQATENALHFATFGPGPTLQLWAATGASRDSVRVVGNIACHGSCALGETEQAVLGDKIFFIWGDGGAERGEELWTVSLDQRPRPLKDICRGSCDSDVAYLRTAGGRVYFSASDGVRGREPWSSDGTPQGTYALGDLAPGVASSEAQSFTSVGDQVYFSATTRRDGFELWTLDPAEGGSGSLLANGRFEVTARFKTAESEGSARMHPFSDDTSFFWFFGPQNTELVVKVLDGRVVNDAFWVFYGALSDVEYWLDVRDRQTGRVQTYYNPPGETCGQADTSAFPEEAPTPYDDLGPASPQLEMVAHGDEISEISGLESCAPGSEVACLQGGKYRVEVQWRSHDGSVGRGQSIEGTDETAYFWFFGPTNVELAVKVLDGRPVNGKYWVFYGALTDVEYTLTVTDTETGASQSYFNQAGDVCGFFDTNAF